MPDKLKAGETAAYDDYFFFGPHNSVVSVTNIPKSG
jgi:hypothetical protein